jgi:hypothetical protein
MLKHIGRHGDRKVAILFREIPGEDHMCLVVYPETLPTHIHDSIMRTLESDVGQQASNLADALHRNLLPDGRVQLVALHQEGMMKKIPTNQVIVTPNAQSTVKLDELNRILKEMETGEQALKKMQELDANTGLVDPAVKREQEREFKRQQLERQAAQQRAGVPPMPVTDGALDDKTLAANMLTQAQRMEIEGHNLIKEAARMKKEAQGLFPNVTAAADAPKETIAETKTAVKAKTTRRVKAADANTVQ